MIIKVRGKQFKDIRVACKLLHNKTHKPGSVHQGGEVHPGFLVHYCKTASEDKEAKKEVPNE